MRIEAVALRHADGTHRPASPQATLERIGPHLARFGITRCADLTGLDRIGIPVHAAIRPQGGIRQTSNGTGLEHVDAQVSALMAAIAHWHAEHPVLEVRRAPLAVLRHEGKRVLAPRGIDGCPREIRDQDRYVLDWACGQELFAGAPAWLPVYAACYQRHQPYRFSVHGLASGNQPIEATLHALYDVIERDALAGLDGPRHVRFERCQVVDAVRTARDDVGRLVEQIRVAGLDLVVLRVPHAAAVHTMIAVLLDRTALGGAPMVHLGTGTHLCPSLAAVRAITGAAQARLVALHGSRDDRDRQADQLRDTPRALFAYFAALASDVTWIELEDRSTDDLGRDLGLALSDVRALGHDHAYTIDLSQGVAGVSTVKLLVPGLRVPGWI